MLAHAACSMSQMAEQMCAPNVHGATAHSSVCVLPARKAVYVSLGAQRDLAGISTYAW